MSACLCDVGYYHDGTTSTEVCLECPVGADCRLPGTTRDTMSDLADCGPHTVEAEDGTCGCAPGYFDDPGDGLVCRPCPEGASCTPTTNTVLPSTLPGYFQPAGG